jgi:hypothetical protein
MKPNLIDADLQPNREPIWGGLAGWNDEPGGWEIHVFCKDGLHIFRSSNPKSALTVAKVAAILRGDDGLQPRAWNISVRNGVLQISQ